MKLKIIGYQSSIACPFHICETKDGTRMNVDILVDGGIEIPEEVKETEEKYVEFCRSLIGREITCNGTHPWVSIADGVSL